MINKGYDHVISLGSFCMTAYHIRRRFPQSKAYPFDWWVTPTVALQDLFETQFSEIFMPQNMKIVKESGNEAVMCQRYGLMHYHDFYEAKVDDRYVPVAIRTKCADNISKYAHLLKRLYSLTGDVLFIRVESGYVQHFNNNRDFDKERLDKFFEVLQGFFPKCSINLLLLNSLSNSDIPEIFCDRLDHYGETTWQGSVQGWDEMFDRTGITMKLA
nr:DUF1796 family putative cysteine peptidase [Sphingomonas sp. PAMC 26605]